MRYFNAGRLALTALMLSVVSLTGCMSTMGPKMPKELGAPSLSSYSQADFKSDVDQYRAAVAAPDLPRALAVRNQIAYHVMANIESEYGSFEMRLTTQRAGFETGADAVQLGISAATTLVGATDVKNILSASLSAFQGTRLSVDKNFFQQKTTESIISQMRTTRKTLQAQLILNLATRDVSSYPLDAVWIDLVDFYYAGTVPSALVGIASSTGASAEGATKKLSDTVAALTPTTPAQAKQSMTNRAAYEKLQAAANGTDAEKSADAIKSLRQILTAAGYAPNPDAGAKELLALFRKAIDDATTDDGKLASLSAAVAGVDMTEYGK
jgi:hypothetical protein